MRVARVLGRALSCAATVAFVGVCGVWLGHRLDPTHVSLGAMPAFSGRDQDGAPITDVTLRGHVVIADFIFTRCTGACPVLSARLVALTRALPASNLRFVSFSVDPEHDTPDVLRAYAARWMRDQRRWRLIAIDRTTLGAIAGGLGMTARDDVDPDPASISHSDRFALIDAGGRERGLYDSVDPRDVARLSDDVRALQRESDRE